MKLTQDNYYSQSANQAFLSVSQYKDFAGTLSRPACEEQALAKLNGTWEQKKTTSLLVGSYVDSFMEGTLDKFKAENPEIFKKDGELKSDYLKANEIIKRIERDELFMTFMSGEKQVIMTAEMFGAEWKIKMDAYAENLAIVDLKVMASLRDMKWTKDYGYMNFVHQWGYTIQSAVYQEVVYRNTGKRLPFFLAAVSKEEYPDIEIIQLEQNLMDEALIEVERNTPNIVALKNGEIKPTRCGVCDYCKHTKVLTRPIWSSELVGEV